MILITKTFWPGLCENNSNKHWYWSNFCDFFSGTLTNHKSSRQVSQLLAQLSKIPEVHEVNLQKPLQYTLHGDQWYVFRMVLISRINSRESWFILTCGENKQVSHAPGTWVGFYLSNYSILQATAQIVVLHSYILGQLDFAAPCEWVHLCLAHGIDCLPFHVEGLCSIHPP